MAEVADRPFLEYLLLQLNRQGIVDVVLCVGHQAEGIWEYFEDGVQWGMRLRYSVEHELLGTAGALKLAEPLIDAASFLVMNGDSFFAIDLRELVHHHEAKRSLATIALAHMEDLARFGTVELDEAGRIVRFVEKAPGRRSGLINSGIYVLEHDVLDLIPEGQAVSLEREIFPTLIGNAFYGVPLRAYFVDIGVPSDYLMLREDPARLLTLIEGED